MYLKTGFIELHHPAGLETTHTQRFGRLMNEKYKLGKYISDNADPTNSKNHFEVNVAKGLNTHFRLVFCLSPNVKLAEEHTACQQCQRFA